MTKYISLALVALGAATASAQAPASLVLPRTNPQATITQRIGVTDLTIKYNRPAVRGRKVFGGLVPFGQIWRTGSDEATTISFSTPVTFHGAAVPAGTYALFTIPTSSQWTVVLNKQAAQWGSYSHQPADDLVRVIVTPLLLNAPVESLTMTVDDVTSTSARLRISWDRTALPIDIGVDTIALTVPRIEEALKAPGRRPYFTAAMFYFENDLDLGKATEWMAAALAESPGHIGMLHRQALILEKRGDRAGALTAARASLAGARESGPELRDEYVRLNEALITRLQAR